VGDDPGEGCRARGTAREPTPADAGLVGKQRGWSRETGRNPLSGY